MSVERRRSRRRSVVQFARIAHSDGSMSDPCMILDVSATGARLQLNGTTEIPDEFTLVLSRNGGVRRRCQIVWRDEFMLGVRFVFMSEQVRSGLPIGA